ncbi:MAG: YraN family protein [Caldimicrobium sp.]|nr:YraN family protein [Caldimicrobium sp.]
MGEDIAKKYLEKQGYKIISQNFRTKTGEIDLIAEKKGTLVFVEVKAGGLGKDGFLPEDKVNYLKIKRLIEASRLFCAKEKKLMDRIREFRYDVLIVDLEKRSVVRHYESAFFAED